MNYLNENPEERERLKSLRKGYITSEETKRKLSESKKGKKQTAE